MKGSDLMKHLCSYLEKFCAWSFDNGIFYFSGRDVYCILTGMCVAFVIWGLIQILFGKDDEK